MRITGIIGLTKPTGRKGKQERVIAHPFGHDYNSVRQAWRKLSGSDEYARLELWDSGRGIIKKNLRPGRERVTLHTEEPKESEESVEDMESLLTQ